MPNKSERRALRSFRRSTKGTNMITKEKKHAKIRCAICDTVLHGVSHGKSKAGLAKQSKSQKRPTGFFAGILCANCRSMIISETAKVKSGMKTMSETDVRIRNYISQIDKKVSA